MLKQQKSGLTRIVHAFRYSMQGLHAAWQNEAAFRQELVLVLLATPLAFFLAETRLELAVLIGSGLLVIIFELINSAIEAVVDQVTQSHTELAGRAKDMGSAAVLLSILLMLVVWSAIACDRFL